MSMRVATFNLESLDDRPGVEPPLAERIVQLRPQLMRLEADILCLQEVNAQRHGHNEPRSLLALDRLLKETAYEAYSWTSSASGKPDALAEKHNLVTLSRWPIIDRQVIWHDLVPRLSHSYVTADQKTELSWGSADSEIDYRASSRSAAASLQPSFASAVGISGTRRKDRPVCLAQRRGVGRGLFPIGHEALRTGAGGEIGD